uniref:Uncharacterized protein n=1 Tax=Schistocephalus solidus TaxID=70667 RepID=A0A0X3PBQ1_SCHSO
MVNYLTLFLTEVCEGSELSTWLSYSVYDNTSSTSLSVDHSEVSCASSETSIHLQSTNGPLMSSPSTLTRFLVITFTSSVTSRHSYTTSCTISLLIVLLEACLNIRQGY